MRGSALASKDWQFLHIKRSQAAAKSPRNIHKNVKREHGMDFCLWYGKHCII